MKIQVNSEQKHSSNERLLSLDSQEQGLAGRELDAWLAVNLMGWIPVEGNWWMGKRPGGGEWNCPIRNADGWAHEYPGGVPWNGKQYCSRRTINWHPSTEIADAIEVEDRIAALGLKHEYVRELTILVTERATNEGRGVEHFDWIHATAKQRSLAAYRAALKATQRSPSPEGRGSESSSPTE